MAKVGVKVRQTLVMRIIRFQNQYLFYLYIWESNGYLNSLFHTWEIKSFISKLIQFEWSRNFLRAKKEVLTRCLPMVKIIMSFIFFPYKFELWYSFIEISGANAQNNSGPATNLNIGMDLWNANPAGSGTMLLRSNPSGISPSGNPAGMVNNQWVQVCFLCGLFSICMSGMNSFHIASWRFLWWPCEFYESYLSNFFYSLLGGVSN